MRFTIQLLAAVLLLSTGSSAVTAEGSAGQSHGEAVVGAWKPGQAEAPGWALLVFDRAGRFSMLAARAPHGTNSRYEQNFPSFPTVIAEPERCGQHTTICSSTEILSGSWSLGIDGGEVVLSFDNWQPGHPSWTRYLQLLLIGDALHPYPDMRGRSPVASTSWLRIDKNFGRRFGM
jgi:hypothetical protein